MTHGETQKHEAHLDTWGQIGHLTDIQQEALTNFLSQVDTSILDKVKFRVETQENVALRFLRARQFNVENAIQLVAECHKKREECHATLCAQRSADENAQCNVHAMMKYYPHGDLGFDRFNRPILFEYSGLVDGNAIYQMTTLEHCLNYHWWTMEYTLNNLFEQAAQRGASVISTCVLVDLTGLNSHHASSLVLNHVKAMVAVDNVCYPETLGKMIVVNAPWLATSLWEMCKGWLDPRTQDKIEILGSGPDVTKRVLEFIDADVLPKRFGGNAADPDFHRDNCEYLWINRHSAARKNITLQPGKKLTLDFYVTDGDVHFESYASTSASPVHLSAQPTVFNCAATAATRTESHSVVGFGDVTKLAQQEHLKSLEKKEVKGLESKVPIRTLLEFSNPASSNENLTFVFFWGNSSRWSQRPLTYVATISDL